MMSVGGEAAQRTYRFRHTGDLKLKFAKARREMGMALDYARQFKLLGDRLAGERITARRFERAPSSLRCSASSRA
jgi:hypothetical protein